MSAMQEALMVRSTNPAFMTTGDVCDALGLTYQTFNQMKLANAFPKPLTLAEKRGIPAKFITPDGPSKRPARLVWHASDVIGWAETFGVTFAAEIKALRDKIAGSDHQDEPDQAPTNRVNTIEDFLRMLDGEVAEIPPAFTPPDPEPEPEPDDQPKPGLSLAEVEASIMDLLEGIAAQYDVCPTTCITALSMVHNRLVNAMIAIVGVPQPKHAEAAE